MDLGLNDRVALVTGASKGMGLAIAAGLASQGARVGMVARTADRLNEAAETVAKEHGVEVLPIVGDVSEPALAERAVADVMDRWGRLDILLNNAGGPPPGSFLDHDDDAWQGALNMNLMSTVRFTRAAAPIMKAANWGRIVNVTSTLAKEPTPAMVLSATARAGVSAFAKAVAAELAPFNITVNTVCPGGVRTDRLMSLLESAAESAGKPLDTLMAEAVDSIPIGRFAEPEEFAQVVLFLASEPGGYVTGTSIMVDGGLTKGVF